MAQLHEPHDPSQDDQAQGFWGSGWPLIILSFLFGLWPLGVFLILRKLLASPAGSAAKARARRPKQSAPARGSAPLAGTGFIVGGGILAGLFAGPWLASLVDALLVGDWTSAVSLGTLTGAGLVLLYVGLFRRKRSKLFRQYLALIGQRDSVSVSTLVSATGRSYKKVCDELQDMLDLGVLPMGYLDLAQGRLVLTSQGIADQPAPQPQPEPEAEAVEPDILSQIRQVSDAIADPAMRAKIDRIGMLTGKILDYRRQNPAKDAQLRSFLNYYLPTTLKILRAYVQLDQQGVEGSNISAAKARVEGMMDKVVEGFETQLDRLFQDQALDITSDVAVLEQMLDQDGLGQNGGLTLGG